MNCKKCNSLIPNDSKFCINCGEKIIVENTIVPKDKSLDENPPKTNVGGNTIGIAIGGIVGYFAVKTAVSFLKPESVEYVQVMLICAAAGLLLVAAIATFIARRILRKENTPHKLINFIAWSNTATWIIPILGLLTSVSTAQFSRSEKLANFRKNIRDYFI